MATIKQKKLQVIKQINKRIKEIETNNEFVLDETMSRIKNFNSQNMTLKQLKTFRDNITKQRIQSQAKILTNYDIKLASRGKEKTPSLTYSQINELSKNNLLDTYKEVVQADFTTKKNKKIQQNILNEKYNLHNLKLALQGESINKALESIKKSEEIEISDFEYLKEIINRTGMEKYKRILDKIENGQMLLDDLKKNMENSNREDWYETVLKSKDYTDSYIDGETFNKNKQISDDRIKNLKNKNFEKVYSDDDLQKLKEMGFL